MTKEPTRYRRAGGPESITPEREAQVIADLNTEVLRGQRLVAEASNTSSRFAEMGKAARHCTVTKMKKDFQERLHARLMEMAASPVECIEAYRKGCHTEDRLEAIAKLEKF